MADCCRGDDVCVCVCGGGGGGGGGGLLISEWVHGCQSGFKLIRHDT